MAGDLSPTAMKVITGLSEGKCLQIASSVTTANVKMFLANAFCYATPTPTNLALGNLISNARANLTSMSGNIFRSPTAFGAVLSQTCAHVAGAAELKSAANFVANTSFEDFGTGVTSISSMSTQGLDTVVGNLTAAANALTAIGPVFDFTDIATLGTGAGLVKRLNQIKLGNYTGVNQKLTTYRVDINEIDDPIYSTTVDQVLASITDPKIIVAVADQFGIATSLSGTVVTCSNSKAQLSSLKDFTDFNKLVNPAYIKGLTANISTLSNKLADMGASFKDYTQAVTLLQSINTPSTPTLNASTSNLTSMMSGLSANIAAAAGSGSSALGTPTLTDFLQPAAGGPAVDAINSLTNATFNTTTVAALETAITTSKSLFTLAGIDLANQPSSFGFQSHKSFATSISDYGADTANVGADKILANMVTSDAFGEAVTSLLAEGKNKVLLQSCGIQPLKFGS